MEIMHGGEQGAHRMSMSVTQLTDMKDQEPATTPSTGERPQE
ncbi:hypothetical protein [Streptomyces afghaniensis]|nr:hypothetical protein [Streptomyces afghaniensis]MDQ1020166.1 hypothetical protein [Streptomyces afghaniensis]